MGSREVCEHNKLLGSHCGKCQDAMATDSPKRTNCVAKLRKAGEHLLRAEVLMRECSSGVGDSKRRRQIWDDSDIIFNMRLKYK